MKSFQRVLLGCFVSAALPLALFAAEPEGATLSANDLAAKLGAKQQDGNSLVRAKLDNGGPRKETLQLQIKTRATRAGTETLYQVIWPKERAGEALLLRKGSGKGLSGAFANAEGVKPLDASAAREPLFGSALAYEDAVENFYGWDQQSLGATEAVNRVTCQILESKPGKGERSIYASVRTWIDLRRMVPLKIEKYDGGGRLVRRIAASRIVTDDAGRSIPANLTISGPDGAESELDGSKIKHDVTFTDEDFSLEALKANSSKSR